MRTGDDLTGDGREKYCYLLKPLVSLGIECMCMRVFVSLSVGG